jgi:hypothetical protein
MQEPVRELYRGFEILLLLRHVESGQIETTFFINPARAIAPQAAMLARELTMTTLHPSDSDTPITDQLDVARLAIDKLLAD